MCTLTKQHNQKISSEYLIYQKKIDKIDQLNEKRNDSPVDTKCIHEELNS